MIDVKKIVEESFPDGPVKRYFSKPLIAFLRTLFHEKEFIEFGKKYPKARGFEFVDRVLEYFNFSYEVDPDELRNIPSQGRAVIISNHPIGSLDGLAFLQMVQRIRPDTKIIANQLLAKLGPLAPVLLPVDNMGGNTAKLQLKAIQKHLKKEGVVIVFPSGVVSRWGSKGIRDCDWRSGFLKFSRSTRAPIVPVFISGRNSLFFYVLSIVARQISTLWLIPEMFKQRNKRIRFNIGKVVTCKAYENLGLSQKQLVERFKTHAYDLAESPEGLFPVQDAVAAPENTEQLKKEVEQSKLLGETADGKQIFFYEYQQDSTVIKELGRLRELTFRMVEEGTGKNCDLDHYDQHYMHLLLWDKNQCEIVGAYRVCDTSKIIPKMGPEGLYSSQIYKYREEMQPYFQQGMELGRSFVQPKYWGKRSLDYLWYGIGALIRSNPKYRYLFGAVSLSDGYPQEAKDLIVYFYATHFPSKDKFVEALYPYQISEEKIQKLKKTFPGESYQSEFTLLKSKLKKLNCTIPTLYKQYAELGEPGGVSICASGLDLAFSNVIDGFVMVDTWKLKPAKKARYIQGSIQASEKHPQQSVSIPIASS